MKKILLATTMFVAASVAAHAEITLSGDARMGVTNNTPLKDVVFSSRARIKFTASGETDGGLSFGATFRVADAVGAGAGTKGSVFVSGAFGKLEMGDNDSAALAVVGHVSSVGYTALGDKNELGYVGGAATNVLYTYSTGGLTFAASAGQLAIAAPATRDAMSVGVKYKTDAYSVALGYETATTGPGVGTSLDQLTIGGSATFSGATVKLVARDNSAIADIEYAASVDYTISGVGVTAFATSTEIYGLGGSYDLGGGAAFKAGAVKAKGVKTVYDAGLTFSF